jgi:hypothetical protein
MAIVALGLHIPGGNKPDEGAIWFQLMTIHGLGRFACDPLFSPRSGRPVRRRGRSPSSMRRAGAKWESAATRASPGAQGRSVLAPSASPCTPCGARPRGPWLVLHSLYTLGMAQDPPRCRTSLRTAGAMAPPPASAPPGRAPPCVRRPAGEGAARQGLGGLPMPSKMAAGATALPKRRGRSGRSLGPEAHGALAGQASGASPEWLVSLLLGQLSKDQITRRDIVFEADF